MKYLISRFECVAYGDKAFKILPNVLYEITEEDDSLLIFGDGVIPFVFTVNAESENILKFEKGLDVFYFLFPTYLNSFTAKVNYKNKDVFINVLDGISIVSDGEILFEQTKVNIRYSHYEIDGEYCLLFFTGKRNYLIVLNNKEILYSDFYDECNIDENEKYFMCKMCDSLNHGKVAHIKDGKFDTYLVYLDDYDLQLKNEFLPHVFLDCVIAKNYKYCNELLSDDIKLKNEGKIKDFFKDFDYFYPISANEFILLKKNTLAGICEFDLNNSKICNIINR